MRDTAARSVLAAATAAVLVAGCGGTGQPAGDGADEEPSGTPSPAPTGAVPAEVIDEARALATDRTGVVGQDLEVVRADDVQWSSTALGCPEEGQAYSQVVTDGYWIVVQAGGEELDLRAADDGQVRLCEGGGEPPMETEEG